jgi:putative MATE family efflux protein
VAPLARAYLHVAFLGSFTVFVLYIGNSVLQAAGNTVVPMLIMGLANVLNLILDPILIFGLLGSPRLGVQGASLATVTSQAVAAATVVILLGGGRLRVHAHLGRWRPRPALAMQIVRIGVPGSGQMLARSLMSLVLMRLVAACGTAAVAAYGIGLRFHMITLMPAFALGNAAATMVGQNLGAGQPGRSHRAAWLAAATDVAVMAVTAAVLIAFAPHLIGVFDRSPEVVTTGTAFLRTTSGFYVFVALAIVFSRSLHGAGDTLAPMIMTIVSLWGLQVPLAVILGRHMTPPTQGIWWAIAIAVSVHGLLITAWFQTGRWKRRQV